MLSSPVIILTFIVYLFATLMIGLYAYRRTKNAADYFLGGRNLPAWVAALSAGASDMSGWLLIGLPGYAYVAGLEAVWIALGLCIGIALSWSLLAKRLRVFSYALDNALTLPSFLQRRFQDTTPWLKGVCAVFILLFFLFYVSSGLIGGAKLFNTVFDLPYHWAVWAGALAIVSYTLFGGFLAVSWTDVMQGLLMLLALIIVPMVVSSQLGGASVALERVEASNKELLDLFTTVEGKSIGFMAIVSLMGWGLGYFGQPHILARFKAVRSPDDIPQAATIAIIWSLLVFAGSLAVGIMGIAHFETPLEDSERVFMMLVEALFHPVVAGILLAAILAAIMSTADSQLLVCSSALAEDLFYLFTQREMSAEHNVRIGRWAVCILALLAGLLAMDPDSQVLEAVAYAWAGLGAAFGPVMLLSVYWRRMNLPGAIAGVLTGGITVVLWKQFSGGIFDLYELVPGFVLSCLAVIAVSLLSKPPSDSVTDQFDRIRQQLG